VKRNARIGLVCLAVAAVAVAGWFVWPLFFPQETRPHQPLEGLREIAPERTVVVPTLDTPVPEGKNAIWSASFQLAWEEVKKNVTRGPVRLDGSGDAAARLNNARSVAGLVQPRDSYSAAGFIEDGIKDRINRELAERFPGVPTPDLEGAENGAAAFAYLRATLRFTTPFPNLDEPLTFTGVDGAKKQVMGYGFSSKARFGNKTARRQVTPLYSVYNPAMGANLFVLDLCGDTTPYQVLVANVPRRPTLLAALTEIDELTVKGPKFGRSLRGWSTLLVPHMRFRVRHRFAELEGKVIRNARSGELNLRRAEQQIDFHLDERGAELETDARGEMPKGEDDYLCTGPFVVLMRKRGEARPFFALLVENDELLEPWH
jgi:hypothetical protein